YAALHLPLDIGGGDRAADILDRRVAQDLDVAGLFVDLDIADVGRETRRLALRIDLHLGADRTAGARCFAGDSRHDERFDAPGIRTSGVGLAVLPLDCLGADVPYDRGALLQLLDNFLRRLSYCHAAGKGDAAASGRGTKADRRRVADNRTDPL